MRRFSDPVEVRLGTSTPDEVPEAFIWRERLYVVREVLDHWRERRAWWRDALDAPDGAPVVTSEAAAREQQVWRVCASRGRSHGQGVYDLACDEGWRLVAVAD